MKEIHFRKSNDTSKKNFETLVSEFKLGDCIPIAIKAWRSVESQTIINCFENPRLFLRLLSCLMFTRLLDRPSAETSADTLFAVRKIQIIYVTHFPPL